MDVLALALCCSVVMWGLGFIGRLPGVMVSAPLLAVLLLGCQVVAGAVGRRHAGWSLYRGAMCGVVSQLVNLLMLASVASDRDPSLLGVWLMGAVALGAAAGALGASMAVLREPLLDRAWWPVWLVAATLGAILSTITLGGLVTSLDVGMAVEDWPATFGTMMWLYPLSRMTGGIYYEHAHRLMGTLVGLLTIMVVIESWSSRQRAIVRALTAVLLVSVIVQGILGGYRVRLDSRSLAAVHGVFAQLVAALAAAILVLRLPNNIQQTDQHSLTAANHISAGLLLGLLIVQVSLGAVLRHFDALLWWHISGALLVSLVALDCGARAVAVGGIPRSLGLSLMIVLGIQLMLGFAAFIAVRAAAGQYPAAMVVIATAHQTVGTVLLIQGATFFVWPQRSTTTRTAPSSSD